MVCEHVNAPGYRYCAQCGQAIAPHICSCGFLSNDAHRFCGGCGVLIAREIDGDIKSDQRGDTRYDLNELLTSLTHVDVTDVAASPIHMAQDDIAAIFAQRAVSDKSP